MKVRALFPLAAAAGFWLPGVVTAQQPATVPANQSLADNVAARLRSANVTTGADLAIVAQDGTVTLTGTVRDAAQKERIIREVRGMSGVTLVRDGIRTGGIVQVQADAGQFPVPPVPGAGPIPAPPGGIPMPIPPVGGPVMPGGPAPIVEPAPLGIPGQFSPDMQAPNLPPYAWPTYAPYNNLSRVAYPGSYPYNAFPFIGPYYPFPKVPLGWRKVTLEWEDGYWYIGRNSAPHDYWRVKFW